MVQVTTSLTRAGLDTNDIPKMTMVLSKAYEYLTMSKDIDAEML